jgi:putative oxidoreductase
MSMSTTLDQLATPVTTERSRAIAAGVGRVLFGLPFAVFGLFHLVGAKDMAAMVPAWVPGGGTFWVVLTGVAMIAASISLVSDRLVRWSGPLLALLLFTYAFTLHLPGVLDGNQMSMPGFLKDLALGGAAVAIGLRKR